jgi:antitoxin HicB
MMIEYPAKVNFSKADKCYLVEFPDLSGCMTYGDTIEEALLNAKEALTGYLESIDLRKIDVPKPSRLKGEDIHLVRPEKQVAFALWLKTKRAEQNLTQRAAAEKLNINFQSYQKFENPRKANPTLKTIERIEKVFNERLLTV